MKIPCRFILITFLAAPAMCAARVSAQSPDFTDYWKALVQAPTAQAALQVPAPVTDNVPAKEIVGGLQRLRKYEFTMDRTDALVAASHLERAVRLSPNDAWAHYALGAALARGSDMRMRPYDQMSSYKPGIYSMAAAGAPPGRLGARGRDPPVYKGGLRVGPV
jgi:hypothetical protein